MIEKDYFNLKKYRGINSKLYYFFDGMFKLRNESKEKTLHSLILPSSTYRENRKTDQIKNENHLVLLKYFNVNLNIISYEKYEKLFLKIYTNFYLDNIEYQNKRDNIKISADELMEELNKYIDNNDYLKPLLILFKTIIIMNDKKAPVDIRKELYADVEYLRNFPDDYFVDEFLIIRNLLFYYYFNDQKYINKLNLKEKYPFLLWIYYQFRGYLALVNNNYFEAITYYNWVCEIYSTNHNVSRFISCKINIAAALNRIGAYSDCIDVISQLIDFTIFQTDNVIWKKYILMHYFIALYMNDEYLKIIELFNRLPDSCSTINVISSLAVAASMYFEKYTQEQVEVELKKQMDYEALREFILHIYKKETLSKELNKLREESLYYGFIFSKL